MLKAAKIQRIRLIISKKYFENVLSALQDIGIMQIETLPDKTYALIGSSQETDYRKISDLSLQTPAMAQRFRGLETLLYPKNVDKKFAFNSIEQLVEQANSVDIDERATQIRKELDSIDVNVKETSSRLELLRKIQDFNNDLSILNTQNVVSFIAYGQQQLKLLEAEIPKQSKTIIAVPLAQCNIFSMKKSDEKNFFAIADKFRVTVEFIPPMVGKIPENKAKLDADLSEANKKKRSLEEELDLISEKYYPIVSALREQFDIEMEKYEVVSRLGISASTIVIEGWAPESSLKKLEKLVKEITDSRYIIEHVKTEEIPPTLLQNPASAKLYEAFTNFYSIPKSNEIDPTLMLAIAFPVFFGFMIGDFGYGLIMLLLSLFIIHRVNHPPKVSHLPKFITGFVSILVTRPTLKVLAKSILPGAILAMGLGIVYNEFFGFHIPNFQIGGFTFTTIYDPTAHLSHLLSIAGYMGVFMVEFGFLLGFLNRLAVGEKKHAIAKIGWFAAGLGIVIIGLAVLHNSLNLITEVASVGLLVAGIVTILAFEGGRGLIEFPSLISHILSYTRLVGILLASLILADVIDTIFLSQWQPFFNGTWSSSPITSIAFGILGIVILVGGQLFNILIALFEPGVQGARLIYVEFFSKFFDGNGKLFKPFATQRNKTLTRFKVEE